KGGNKSEHYVVLIFQAIIDDLGRLTEACRVGGTHQMCETYAYDNNGNRLSTTVNGETTTASYTLDDQLEVYGDNSYRYDDDGYLIEKITPDGTTTYTYGTMGELSRTITECSPRSHSSPMGVHTEVR
ncbi:MAG: hypothetical protein ABXS91_05410, partial [Sulfurimonas sp.]